MKLNVMTIVGTRPEIIRLSECIKACDLFFDHTLVHTGQNYDYELNEIFFKEFGLRKPDYFLNCAGENLGETMGNIISASYAIIDRCRPDAILLLGDTNSALSAISAKRHKVPIFHMEAGNRCFDENVPEEVNRRIVDHISDINLPYTEHSRRYLLDEGIKKERIFVTGSPMKEVLAKNRNQIESSTVLETLGIEKDQYILLSAHREENVDNKYNFRTLVSSINALAVQYDLPIIYSVHPRTQKRIAQEKIVFNPLVRQLKPFGFFDYNKLQQNAFCVLSDSGTLSEESAILGFPAVLIRTSTERNEVLDAGSIVIGGIKKESVIQSVELARAMLKCGKTLDLAQNYQSEQVSIKVAKIIQSYTSIINALVWRKQNGDHD